MYDTPVAPLIPREPAPGAQAAFHCGLWSLLLNLLAACFPLAIPLGIVALVKDGRARLAAELEPERYEAPGAAARALGIAGIAASLVAWGWLALASVLFSAVREARLHRAVPRTAPPSPSPAQVAQVEGQMDLAARALRERAAEGRRLRAPLDPGQLVAEVLRLPRMQYPQADNAYRPGSAPFLAADAPTQDGQISLEARPHHQDPATHRRYAAVVIRGRVCPPGGGIRLLERIVEVE